MTSRVEKQLARDLEDTRRERRETVDALYLRISHMIQEVFDIKRARDGAHAMYRQAADVVDRLRERVKNLDLGVTQLISERDSARALVANQATSIQELVSKCDALIVQRDKARTRGQANYEALDETRHEQLLELQSVREVAAHRQGAVAQLKDLVVTLRQRLFEVGKARDVATSEKNLAISARDKAIETRNGYAAQANEAQVELSRLQRESDTKIRELETQLRDRWQADPVGHLRSEEWTDIRQQLAEVAQELRIVTEQRDLARWGLDEWKGQCRLANQEIDRLGKALGAERDEDHRKLAELNIRTQSEIVDLQRLVYVAREERDVAQARLTDKSLLLDPGARGRITQLEESLGLTTRQLKKVQHEFDVTQRALREERHEAKVLRALVEKQVRKTQDAEGASRMASVDRDRVRAERSGLFGKARQLFIKLGYGLDAHPFIVFEDFLKHVAVDIEVETEKGERLRKATKAQNFGKMYGHPDLPLRCGCDPDHKHSKLSGHCMEGNCYVCSGESGVGRVKVSDEQWAALQKAKRPRVGTWTGRVPNVIDQPQVPRGSVTGRVQRKTLQGQDIPGNPLASHMHQKTRAPMPGYGHRHGNPQDPHQHSDSPRFYDHEHLSPKQPSLPTYKLEASPWKTRAPGYSHQHGPPGEYHEHDPSMMYDHVHGSLERRTPEQWEEYLAYRRLTNKYNVGLEAGCRRVDIELPWDMHLDYDFSDPEVLRLEVHSWQDPCPHSNK